ncbi:HAD family hydrolase [Cognatishimia sp.]|uniref:HAD family hydrolase n=1 Tax=Cognatishimia sp. TaxID=2211648 RepID=UPI003514A132
MALTHVLFDWDGTLARTLDLWLLGNQRAFETRGYDFDPETIVREFFHNHDTVPDRYPHMDFPSIAAEVRSFVMRNLPNVALYEDAVTVLDACRARGLTISLVSSSARGLLETGLDAHSLGTRFGSTIAGDDGFGHKPDTRPFRETLRRVGATPKETLVIGDSHVDIDAGRAMGCRTCLFAPEPNRLFHDHAASLAKQPDHVVENWPSVLELI